MTAGERLHQLAGISGTAAALLLAIGAGATTGAALVDYSGLATGTAAEHLLAEHAPVVVVAQPGYRGGGLRRNAAPQSLQAVASAIEAERARAAAAHILLVSARASEAERATASAEIAQIAAASTVSREGAARALAASRLDMARVIAMDDEDLAAGLL